MTSLIPFDTLRYANALQEADINEKIAHAHAKAQAGAWAEAIETQLVTKQDLHNAMHKSEVALQTVDHKLSKEIQRVDHKVDALEKNLRLEIKRVDNKIDALDKNIHVEMKLLGKNLLIKLGSIMVGSVALLGGLTTVLHLY
jgi:hypothetical protein